MPTEKPSFRIDWVHTETHVIDEESRRFGGTLIPDPERYEWKIIDDKKYLLDKFDNLLIPVEEITKMFENLKPQPIYYSAPKISDINVYVKKRIPSIKKFLTDTTPNEYSFVDKSEEFLKDLEKDKMRFVILTVDLKSSTKMSQKLDGKQNAKLITLFVREMASVVNNYHGYVLKYTGDGLIAYFPEPNFIGMNDLAVDCSLGMKLVLRDSINKVLRKMKLPKLKLRVGIDSGEAIIVDMGHESIKQHKDLIGETMNLSSKIQSVAPENGIAIGDSTARNLHSSRRKFFVRTIPKDWKYTTKNGDVYPLHMYGN